MSWNFIPNDYCCGSDDCKDECRCEELHSDCAICGAECGCWCDEIYDSWKDSQLD